MIAVSEKNPAKLSVIARDTSRQKKVEVDVPVEATIGELVEGIRGGMNLPRHDIEGRPLNWKARLEREGRHLHGSELAGDALREKDEIVLQPHITAG